MTITKELCHDPVHLVFDDGIHVPGLYGGRWAGAPDPCRDFSSRTSAPNIWTEFVRGNGLPGNVEICELKGLTRREPTHTGGILEPPGRINAGLGPVPGGQDSW